MFTLLLVLFDAFYSTEFQTLLWTLLILPALYFISKYPSWKVVISIGLGFTGIKYLLLFYQEHLDISRDVFLDLIVSSSVNWSVYIGFSVLLIRHAELTKELGVSQEEVRNQKIFLEAILDNMEEQVVACDADGNVHYFNHAAQQFFLEKNIPFEQWEWEGNLTFYEEDGETLISPQDIPLYRAMNGEQVLNFPMWITINSLGEQRYLMTNGKPLVNAKGEQTGAVIVFHDLTEEKKLVQEKNAARKQYRSLFKHNYDAVYLMDVEGNFLTSNPACQQIAGYTNEEMRKLSFHSLIVVEDLQKTLAHFQKAKEGNTQKYEITIINKHHERVVLDVTNIPNIVNGKIVGVYGIARDITKQKQNEEKIRHLAYYDQLTGLPNRMLFKDRALQSWKHAAKEKNVMAVLFLDLDGFKVVNDTLGHNVGDEVLIQVSERFMHCLDVDHTLARLGGDEFTVLLPVLTAKEDAHEVANKLIHALKEPFVFDDLQFYLSVSIGVSYYTGQEEIGVNTLIKQADTAMYYVKERGKADFIIYNEWMDTEALQRVKLEKEFRDALKHQEFIVDYQPIVNSKSSKMVGVEALVRWNHKKLGRISPADFIPLAEDTGLIIPLGEWVLRTACLKAQEWQEQGLPPIKVSVNISVKQLQQRDKFIAQVERILEETKLNPKWLEFEITETILIEKEETLLHTLHQIDKMGISISIDDFGTGYSSMSQLKNFEVKTLKIDQSFIEDVHSDETSKAIVKSIMTLANQLQLNTIAEGVENQEQLLAVWEENCKEIQGYYFSPPVSPQEIESLLSEKRKIEFPIQP